MTQKLPRRAAQDRHLPPPPGPPWDLPMSEAPLCFLDLEMTGLRPETDRVIELCLVRAEGPRETGSLSSLVRPACGSFGNGHVHGIRAEDLEGAPTFAELAPQVEALLDGAIPVAHAAVWDVAFLEAELARAGRPRTIEHFLDTLVLSRRSFAQPSHRLTALTAALGIEHPQAHRAGDDVKALRGLFRVIEGALSPRTPRDLWHVRVGERHARPDLVEAARASIGRPVRIRYRPSHRAPEELCFTVTGVRTDLDPPRVLGYLLPSRSRRELRADRILAIEGAEPPLPSGGGTRA
ncbi:MAG: 3'-5' exonuclease [Byssovorax sp.]